MDSWGLLPFSRVFCQVRTQEHYGWFKKHVHFLQFAQCKLGCVFCYHIHSILPWKLTKCYRIKEEVCKLRIAHGNSLLPVFGKYVYWNLAMLICLHSFHTTTTLSSSWCDRPCPASPEIFTIGLFTENIFWSGLNNALWI